MQEAFGGILNIVLIVVFLVIVEGILGFAVSYTKAFRMKNYVISVVEQYDAAGCLEPTAQTGCKDKIKQHAHNIAYRPSSISCQTDEVNVEGYYCISAVKPEENAVADGVNSAEYKYYRVVTQVDINIPIIKNIMGLRFFQVTGDTRLIKLYN